MEKKVKKQSIETEKFDDIKIKSAINLLVEKLTHAGVDLNGKTIIINNKQLTIK